MRAVMMAAGLKRNCSRPYAATSTVPMPAPSSTVRLRRTTFQRQRDRTPRMVVSRVSR